jgi:hypothetical protein
VTPSAKSVERSARTSASFERAVRAGLVVYGGVHLLIAALAVKLATTGSHTSSQGALAQAADSAWGVPVIVVLVAGFAILAVWQAIAALVGYRHLPQRRRTLMRLGATCRLVSYAYFAVAVSQLAAHRGSDAKSGPSPRQASSDLLAQPAGRLALGVTGLVIVGIGVGLVVFGVRREFLDQIDHQGLDTPHRGAVITLGVTGYVAKGLAFVVVGALVTVAALTNNPRQSGGLDHSLERVLGHGWGTAAIAAFGVGVGCFGFFLLARAFLFRRATMTA